MYEYRSDAPRDDRPRFIVRQYDLFEFVPKLKERVWIDEFKFNPPEGYTIYQTHTVAGFQLGEATSTIEAGSNTRYKGVAATPHLVVIFIRS